MLIAPTEGGVYSNPNDTDIMHPLGVMHRVNSTFSPGSAGPRGPAGLLQGNVYETASHSDDKYSNGDAQFFNLPASSRAQLG